MLWIARHLDNYITCSSRQEYEIPYFPGHGHNYAAVKPIWANKVIVNILLINYFLILICLRSQVRFGWWFKVRFFRKDQKGYKKYDVIDITKGDAEITEE